MFVTERDNVFASHINGQSMLKSVCVCVCEREREREERLCELKRGINEEETVN